MLAQARQLGVRGDQLLAHVLRVRARVADPLDAVDAVDQREQVGEVDALLARQVAPVGVDVLPQQRDLPDAVRRERLDLVHDCRGGRLRSRPRVLGTMQ